MQEATKSIKNFILNASPLIYFCRIGLSKIFAEFKEEKVTTPLVIKEVVKKGEELGFPDAFLVEKLVEEGIISIKSPKKKDFLYMLSQIPELHEAETQVLALAEELNGIAILDDSDARQIAKIFNIEVQGSAYLLLRLNYRNKLSKQEAIDVLNNMISAGWRLSVEDYTKVLDAFK